MSKKRITSLIFILIAFFSFFYVYRCRELPDSVKEKGISVIDKIEEVKLTGYGMYNPGVLDLGDSYLLVARQKASSFFNYIGLKIKGERKNIIVVAELDKNFQEIKKAKQITFPDSEKFHKITDPRLFMHDDQIYMIFSNHSSGGSVQTIAKLEKEEGEWKVKEVLPLFFSGADEFYAKKLVLPNIEKNWMPFSKNGKIHIVYLLEPEKIVLEADLETGNCVIVSRVSDELEDQFSPLRGGTPPIYDPELDEFITLYHVAYPGRASFSTAAKKVYICGAYTFTNALPYKMTAKSSGPFYQEDLYANKLKIVFPTALVSKGDDYLMFYGEDDLRIKVATIKKENLISTMKKSPSKSKS
jgi:predicted GH43/DUF377 family glycosyl hydrolase